MRQRHHIVFVVVVCLTAIFDISCAARLDKPSSASTDSCRKQVDKDDALIVGGYEKGGVVHFPIDIDKDVDDVQKKAFRAGMEMWNDHTQTTKFVFEERTASTPAVKGFRLQRGSRDLPNPAESEKTSCTGYGSPGSIIWYSPENMDWVTTQMDINAAGRIYAHELGHALGVAHKPSKASIMYEGDTNVACAYRARISPVAIPKDDAQDAYTCGHGARQKKADEQRKQQKSPPV